MNQVNEVFAEIENIEDNASPAAASTINPPADPSPPQDSNLR